MRRAFPQKVKSVICHSSAFDDVLEAEQQKQASSDVNRKARTSAAMVGLALSMGASSLLLPRQDDTALASEPRAVDLEILPNAQPSPAEAQALRSGEVATPVVEYGDWQSSPVRGFNEGLGVSAVGQPSSLDAPVAPSADTVAESANERSAALLRLRQQRERLRNTLAEYGGEESVQSTDGKAVVQPSLSDKASNLSDGLELAPEVDHGFDDSELQPYRVQPGDTLSSISRAHSVSQRTLIAINRLGDANQLWVNQTLLVPSSPQKKQLSSVQQVEAQPQSQSSASLSLAHVPSVAESSGSFAPAGVPNYIENRTVAPASTSTHRVVSGETVDQLARRYNVPRSSLIAANRLSNPNLIRVGQVLNIPTFAESFTPAQPAALDASQAKPEWLAANNSPVSLDDASAEPASPESLVVSLASPVVPSIAEPESVGGDRDMAMSVTPEASSDTGASNTTLVGKVASSSVEIGSSASYANQFVSDLSTLQPSRQIERAEIDSGSQQPVLVAAASTTQFASTIPDFAPSAPEFNPNSEFRGTESLRVPQVNQVAASPQTVDEPVAEVVQPSADADSQVIAAAPIGSENYEPLLEPLIGRFVSPELPPLPGADAFLPEGAPVFNGYAWPARGVLTSGYGWRWGRMHRGIDIGAPTGTPIYAAAAGVVEFAGWNSGGYGYMVDIRHPDGSRTRYAHSSRLFVRAGQEVAQGDHIAAVGSTGYSTGPHLHFEIHLPSQGTVNPISMLPSR
ncbi:peptidoglycan DD-metalloendopeptidase family protein [Leptolyngbya sp. AN02str]|uniref:peptidoglycan DD-metalloendopeptidase family protein n=1 Tax=Leptolyngbya sp. AN02str TaxID=3423363 RepID=UPI003D32234B